MLREKYLTRKDFTRGQTLTQPMPLPSQSADVPSLEEKVRKMIDEDLVVSIFVAFLLINEFCSGFRSVLILCNCLSIK